MTEIEVGPVEDFPLNEFRVVEIEGREVGILRTGESTAHAVRNFCPHRGAPICTGTVSGTMVPSSPGDLVFAEDRLVLRCPWHLLEFDLRTGEAAFGTTRRRLAAFDVAIADGRVVVSVPWVRAAA